MADDLRKGQSRVPLCDLTIDNVRAGKVVAGDLTIRRETLIEQAALAQAKGYPELARNFRRAAVLNGTIFQYDERYGLTAVDHPAGRITVAGRLNARHSQVRIVVRAIDVTLSLSKPREISIRTMLEGTIAAIEPSDGPVVIAEVALTGGDRLAAAITRKAVDELGLDSGDAVYCLIKAVSIDERLMPAP